MDLKGVEGQIAAASTQELATELLVAYGELKSRYFRRDYRPGQLEGGRFAEAAFRILQHVATGAYTPVGKTLPKLPELMRTLEATNGVVVHESVRIHIPRALAVVYNVRNRRDIGHIAADVDANVMDAEMVVANCNWVLAEFVRLFHSCTPEEAHAIVQAIVRREAPLIQTFGDRPAVLATTLTVREEILLILYHQGELGASISQLDEWMRTAKRAVIRARLSDLELKDRFVVRHGDAFVVTDSGIRHVEQSLLER